MLVSYDFDIRWNTPRELTAEPTIGKLRGDVAHGTDAHDKYAAVFRDPAVIGMIERADPVLRDYLEASGFDLVASRSGVPAGFCVAADKSAITDVLQRLNQNLPNFALKGADLGGFDFAALLMAVTTAQPLVPEAGWSRVPVDAGHRAMPPEPNAAGESGPKVKPLRARIGALALSLAGPSLVAYLAVKCFAAPASF